MKTMIACIHIDGTNGTVEVEFEVEDDATKKEIDAAGYEAAMDVIDIWVMEGASDG